MKAPKSNRIATVPSKLPDGTRNPEYIKQYNDSDRARSVRAKYNASEKAINTRKARKRQPMDGGSYADFIIRQLNAVSGDGWR